ncbi:MAG: hypothetical protein AB1403_15845 [Candidatus Riflebacteria bacterium]
MKSQKKPGPATFLMFAVIANSLISMLLAGFYVTELNQEFFFCFKFLTPPFLVIAFILLKMVSNELLEEKVKLNWLARVVIFAAIYFFLILGSTGYVEIVNANFGEQPKILVSGKIDRLFKIGKSNKPVVSVFSQELGRPVRRRISREEYSRLEVGREYSFIMRQGCLGILYHDK